MEDSSKIDKQPIMILDNKALKSMRYDFTFLEHNNTMFKEQCSFLVSSCSRCSTIYL